MKEILKKLYPLFLASNGVATDTRKIKTGEIFFALKGGNFDGNQYAEKALELGASHAVIDDYSLAKKEKNFVFVKDVLNTLQALARHHRDQLQTSVIGLTGSNGKTTSKELIGSVLSQSFNIWTTQGNLNNHIGVPLTLLQLNASHEVAIIEMGANHQKEIELLSSICKPDIGYITNFGFAHLEGFGGFEGVVKGKSELYDFLKAHEKKVLIHMDDELQIKKSSGIEKRIEFSTQLDSNCLVKKSPSQHEFLGIQIDNIKIQSNLTGDYNLTNVAAAVALGKYFGLDLISIKKGIEEYAPKNSRSQMLKKGDKKIILDAYNANPSSMRAAILNLSHAPTSKAVFLGDMFELGEKSHSLHQEIVDLLFECKVDEVFLVGEHFFSCQTKNGNTWKFLTLEELSKHLLQIEVNAKTILIKGSRGMTMEKVMDDLG